MVLTTQVVFKAQTVQHRIDGIPAAYLVQPDGISVGLGDEINLPEEAAYLPVLKYEPQFLVPVHSECAKPAFFYALADTDASESHENIGLCLDRRKQGNDQEHIPKLFLVKQLPCRREPEIEYPTRKSMWNLPFHFGKFQSA